MHVDKSFKKIQAGVRPPPPIQAMPVFWELLVRHSLPERKLKIYLHIDASCRWGPVPGWGAKMTRPPHGEGRLPVKTLFSYPAHAM